MFLVFDAMAFYMPPAESNNLKKAIDEINSCGFSMRMNRFQFDSPRDAQSFVDKLSGLQGIDFKKALREKILIYGVGSDREMKNLLSNMITHLGLDFKEIQRRDAALAEKMGIPIATWKEMKTPRGMAGLTIMTPALFTVVKDQVHQVMAEAG